MGLDPNLKLNPHAREIIPHNNKHGQQGGEYGPKRKLLPTRRILVLPR